MYTGRHADSRTVSFPAYSPRREGLAILLNVKEHSALTRCALTG